MQCIFNVVYVTVFNILVLLQILHVIFVTDNDNILDVKLFTRHINITGITGSVKVSHIKLKNETELCHPAYSTRRVN